MTSTFASVDNYPLVILAKAASWCRVACYETTGCSKTEHFQPTIDSLKMLIKQAQEELADFENRQALVTGKINAHP